MKLRETIAYNKDLITGLEKTIKKFKDADAPLINTMIIELFDAKTGEKTYEAKAENVVLNIIAKMAYMDYFYAKIKGAITSAPYANIPFQLLILTDYAGAEDAANIYMRGNLIGWADKSTTYSGSDSKRGTINLSETKLDVVGDGLLHFVFDFPTNAANGTFQTAWWAFNISNTLVELNHINIAYSYNIISVYANGVINTGNGIPAASALTKFSLDYTTTGTISPTSMPAISPNGADYDGTNIWIIDYANKKLHKFSGDMTTWLSSISVTGWNVAWGTGINDITELNGTIYALSSSYYIVTINGATGVCGTGLDLRAKLGIPLAEVDSNAGLTSNGIDKIFVGCYYNSIVYCFDSSFNLICTMASPYGYFFRLSFDRNTGIMYSNVTNTYSYRYKMELTSPGAQNLLAAPVTKTATNTMKIQYDFQIQKVL